MVRHWDWALARAAAMSMRKVETFFILILLTAVGRDGRWFGEKSEGIKVEES
jgi:hypothetical protein